MRLPRSRGARLAAISASVLGAPRPAAGVGHLVEREPRVGVGRRCVRQAHQAVPGLAELVAVEARLGRRRLGVAALGIGLGRRIVAIVAPDRLVADQRIDGGVGRREIVELDVGEEDAIARDHVLGCLRQDAVVGIARRLGPAHVEQGIAVGLLGIGGQGAVGAERVALFHRLLHAHAIAQGHQAVEPQAPAQRLVVRRQRGQQRIESRERRIGAVEAARRVGRPDLRAPAHHGARLLRPRSAACCRQLPRRRRARPCRAGRRLPRCARLDCRATAAPPRHRLSAPRPDCRRGGRRIPRPSAARRARRAGRRACAAARAPRRCARRRSAPATAAAATRSRRGSGARRRAPAAPPRRSGRDRGRRAWRRAAHSRAGRVCRPSRRRRWPRRPCRPAAAAS